MIARLVLGPGHLEAIDAARRIADTEIRLRWARSARLEAEFSRRDWADPRVLRAAMARTCNSPKPLYAIINVIDRAERDEDYRARLVGSRKPAATDDVLHSEEREALNKRSEAIRQFDAVQARLAWLSDEPSKSTDGTGRGFIES